MKVIINNKTIEVNNLTIISPDENEVIISDNIVLGGLRIMCKKSIFISPRTESSLEIVSSSNYELKK